VIDFVAHARVRVNPHGEDSAGGCAGACGAMWITPRMCSGRPSRAASISTTGVGGLTLGGGLGHLSRSCGLTIDNLLTVDNGSGGWSHDHRQRRAEYPISSGHVRGGGGNSAWRRLSLSHPPGPHCHRWAHVWPIEDAPEVMQRYEEFITDAPEEINGFLHFW